MLEEINNIKPFELSKEVKKSEHGYDYKTYFDDELIERKLYLTDKKGRLKFEDYKTYKFRRLFYKMFNKEKLKGTMIHNSRNWEAKKFLKDTVNVLKEDKELSDEEKKENLNKALFLSKSCNKGTYIKNQ